MAGQFDHGIAETTESIAARLDGAKEAQRQTRFTLGLMTLISMLMLFPSFVHEAPVLGTISLFVAALWLLLITRRERHTVESLLRETDTLRQDEVPDALGDESPPPRSRPSCSLGQRSLVFHTIAANSLFLSLDTEKIGWAFARDFFFWLPVCVSLAVFSLAAWQYQSAAVFLACWIPLLACCRVAASNSKATDRVLRDYGERLRSDVFRRRPRPAADSGRRRAHAIIESTSKLTLNPH